MDNFRIKIPNPCSEDWAQMNSNGIGRHCSLCEKTVIDFTVMNQEEIKTYFKTYTSQKTCGHFLKSQLSEVKKENILLRFRTRVQSIQVRPMRYAVLFLLSIVITLVGCENKTEPFINGDTIYVGDSNLTKPCIDTDSTSVK